MPELLVPMLAALAYLAAAARLVRLLRAGQEEFLAELRSASAMFLRFGGIDYDQDERHAHEHKPRMIIAGFSAYSRILDFPRHLGQHSGGMVLCAGALDQYVPLENARMPGRTVLQWDKSDCEDMGMVKVDLLGLGVFDLFVEVVLDLDDLGPRATERLADLGQDRARLRLVLDEDVALGEHRDHHVLEDLALDLRGPLDVGADAADQIARGVDLFGGRLADPHGAIRGEQLEVTVDGERVKLFDWDKEIAGTTGVGTGARSTTAGCGDRVAPRSRVSTALPGCRSMRLCTGRVLPSSNTTRQLCVFRSGERISAARMFE